MDPNGHPICTCQHQTLEKSGADEGIESSLSTGKLHSRLYGYLVYFVVMAVRLVLRRDLNAEIFLNKDKGMFQLPRSFKYMSVDSALRRLSSGELYFASSRQLNDSLEVKFSHATVAEEQRALLEVFSAVSVSQGGPTWSYQPESEADIHEMEQMISRRNDDFQESLARVGIFATGKRPDHQAMWAYYADERKGVCFELEWNRDVVWEYGLLFRDVEYTSGPRVINQSQHMANAITLLSRQHPDADVYQLQKMSLDEAFRRQVGLNLAGRAASIKHLDWAHEDELRVLVARSRSLPILRSVLKAVHIVGFECLRFAEIYGLLRSDYPGVKIYQWTFDHGEISSIARELQITLVPVPNLNSGHAYPGISETTP